MCLIDVAICDKSLTDRKMETLSKAESLLENSIATGDRHGAGAGAAVRCPLPARGALGGDDFCNWICVDFKRIPFTRTSAA